MQLLDKFGTLLTAPSDAKSSFERVRFETLRENLIPFVTKLAAVAVSRIGTRLNKYFPTFSVKSSKGSSAKGDDFAYTDGEDEDYDDGERFFSR